MRAKPITKDLLFVGVSLDVALSDTLRPNAVVRASTDGSPHIAAQEKAPALRDSQFVTRRAHPGQWAIQDSNL